MEASGFNNAAIKEIIANGNFGKIQPAFMGCALEQIVKRPTSKMELCQILQSRMTWGKMTAQSQGSIITNLLTNTGVIKDDNGILTLEAS